ncbi:MAG: hypothetical protein CL923_03195 [Deltaproteobacteria bacterium]|jgi:UPF0716 protein FxsA|nr:hypothetical protein [Deltaproteobacteria bacterium]MBQ31545.1 hypothetical protein [Deltaproteobacteria bacterium]MDP7158387.1 FxsA family protein [SAR324 cluster bacterium]MDP7318761.1 FxsA family protein [SAR324 cluster bacterium]MDP7631164.1 FxsA family protein [SAR324 cluster bacterium]|tara:strand:+ start:237 stop:623 length:387 start_codon:yes stop_codon:yes gene_type:complete
MVGGVLTLFLFLIPVLEITLLLLLAERLPVFSLFTLSGVTAGAGWWFMRSEDFSLWTLIETELQNQRLPTEELLNDFLLWTCGMLLVVPGVVTDAAGFVLLVPVCREELSKWTRQQMHRHLQRKNLRA